MTEQKEEKDWKFMGVIIFVFFLLIMGLLWAFHSSNNPSFKFIIDGNKEDAVVKCSMWNYSEIEFIPCIWNGIIQGIPNEYINITLSPQDNCASYNSTFPGFNLKNDTIAKEIYDSTVPICDTIYASNLTEEWLYNNASCIDYDCPLFYAQPPHVPFSRVSCVLVYQIPFLEQAKRGYCVTWENEGLLIQRDG